MVPPPEVRQPPSVADEAQGHPRDQRDPMVTPGGDGTPPVREHAVPELAMARETHPATTRALIADGSTSSTGCR